VNTRRIDILQVEDSEGDIRLTQEALKGSTLSCLHHVHDGVDAMAFLHQDGPYSDAPRPDLILLDLNMPRKDGREVLAEIKEADELKSIPVVIFTTSDAERDIATCYRLHCNCYITKPMQLADFFRVVQGVEKYWGTLVRGPAS